MDDGQQQVVPAIREAIVILLVEHNSGDVAQIRRALDCTGASYRIEVLTTASAAIERLRESLDCLEEKAPDLILVDLHLPDSAAQLFLAELRCHDKLRNIPVVALTSPLNDDASLEAFDLEAWHCVRKTAELPVLADRLRRAMRCCLGEYPLRIGDADPVGQTSVAEALIFRLNSDRPRRRDEQTTTDRQTWQPARRDVSFWRRRRSA